MQGVGVNEKYIVFIAVAPIVPLRMCVIRIVTFKGGQPMW